MTQEGLNVLEDLSASPDASPRDLTESQISLLRQTFEDPTIGLYLFAKFIFGYEDLIPDLHLDISRFISCWGESILEDGSTITHPVGEWDHVTRSYRRLMVCIPREMFKTSLCTRANALWTIARDPTHDSTVGIFNEKADNAEAWLGAICEVVESSLLFQVIWKEMIPPGIGFWDKESGVSLPRRWKWGGTGIRFIRNAVGIPELSIEGHGIGGATTGKHFTHKILDDIIGEKASESAAVMQDAINWVDNSRPLERPAEGGCELVVHTPWGYADVYAHMLKRWPGDYLVYKRHILEDKNGRPDPINGRSIFPQKISTDKAKQLLKINNFVNYAQYMCIPKVGRETSFSEDWIRFGKILYSGDEPIFSILEENFDPDIQEVDCPESDPPIRLIPLSWFSIAIIIDPIPGKPTEFKKEPDCQNGIVVVAKDPWGRRFLLESRRLRCTPTELFKEVSELSLKWGVSRVGIEEVNFSYVFLPLFNQLGRAYGVPNLELRPLSPGGRQKDERIKFHLQGPMENGFWYFNEAGTQTAIQELTEFPHSQWRDVIDALSYSDKMLGQRPETPNEWAKRYYESPAREPHRGGLTGYGEFF